MLSGCLSAGWVAALWRKRLHRSRQASLRRAWAAVSALGRATKRQGRGLGRRVALASAVRVRCTGRGPSRLSHGGATTPCQTGRRRRGQPGQRLRRDEFCRSGLSPLAALLPRPPCVEPLGDLMPLASGAILVHAFAKPGLFLRQAGFGSAVRPGPRRRVARARRQTPHAGRSRRAPKEPAAYLCCPLQSRGSGAGRGHPSWHAGEARCFEREFFFGSGVLGFATVSLVRQCGHPNDALQERAPGGGPRGPGARSRDLPTEHAVRGTSGSMRGGQSQGQDEFGGPQRTDFARGGGNISLTLRLEPKLSRPKNRLATKPGP